MMDGDGCIWSMHWIKKWHHQHFQWMGDECESRSVMESKEGKWGYFFLFGWGSTAYIKGTHVQYRRGYTWRASGGVAIFAPGSWWDLRGPRFGTRHLSDFRRGSHAPWWRVGLWEAVGGGPRPRFRTIASKRQGAFGLFLSLSLVFLFWLENSSVILLKLKML